MANKLIVTMDELRALRNAAKMAIGFTESEDLSDTLVTAYQKINDYLESEGEK